VEDARNHLKEGDTVNAMIINVDRKNRNINLSIKAKDSVRDLGGDGAHADSKRRPGPRTSARCSRPSSTRSPSKATGARR
jgi:ribosomal protein S1